MKGAKGVIRGEMWRGSASLLISATQEELGRAGERSSWVGGEGGEGSTGVAGEADRFEAVHFGCGVCGGARDGSLKEGNSCKWDGIGLQKTPIRLENNAGASDDSTICTWRNPNICSH